jgi:hypothetical protein
MNLYEQYRPVVEYALKKGWIRYPNNSADIVQMPFMNNRPKKEPKPPAPRKCRGCGNVWYDGAKSCPNCLREQWSLAW